MGPSSHGDAPEAGQNPKATHPSHRMPSPPFRSTAAGARRAAAALWLVVLATSAHAGWFDKFKDPDDGAFDMGDWLLDQRGFLPMPIIITEPAVGFGAGVVATFFRESIREAASRKTEDGRLAPPDIYALGGAATENGTWLGMAGGMVNFDQGRYRWRGGVSRMSVNLDFFGIGRIPGRSPVSVPLQMEGTIYFGEGMRRVAKNIFVGPRFQYRRLSASLEGTPPPGGFQIPPLDVRSNSAAIGMHLQRDLRDSTFYPTKGSLFDFTDDFFDQAWGSRREYQTYKIGYNGFREIVPGQVFAYRLMGCSANGIVPFYDLCLYGFNSDLRGYTTGQFQNRRMFATQGEYRLTWQKRLGFVAFGGVGGTARTWSEFRSDQLLPAGGVGLRFNLDKKNHINYRVDLGFGREGRTVSIGVGEAF